MIEHCQDFCNRISEKTVIPLNLKGRTLTPNQKNIVLRSLRAYVEDSHQGATILIKEIETEMRSLIKKKLSSSDPDWYKNIVEPILGSKGSADIINKYKIDRGLDGKEIYNEDNPLEWSRLGHLDKIIRDQTLWQSHFMSVFGSEMYFKFHFDIAKKIRHRVAHIRPQGVLECEYLILPAIWLLEKLP